MTKKKTTSNETKIRTLNLEALVSEICETLRNSDCEIVADIANKLLVPDVRYIGANQFTQDIETSKADTYRVTWVIDIPAESPRAAAETARRIQLDPESSATIFDVSKHPDGNMVEIDVGDWNG